MAIRPGYPLTLPAFRFDGTPYEWAGRAPSAGDATLPVAYLAAQLEAMGCAVLHRPPAANAAGCPLRMPRVVLGGPADLYDTMTAAQVEQMDALGVIHATLPPVPAGTGGDDAAILSGLPVSPGPASVPPGCYVGGDLLVFGPGLDTATYFVETVDNQYEYEAQPGGDLCLLFGGVTATGTIPDTVTASGALSATYAPKDAVVAPEVAAFVAAAARFRRVRSVYVFDNSLTDVTATPSLACEVTGPGDRFLIGGSEVVSLGTDEDAVAARRAAWADVVAGMDGNAEVVDLYPDPGDTGTTYDYAAAVVAFFSEG